MAQLEINAHNPDSVAFVDGVFPFLFLQPLEDLRDAVMGSRHHQGVVLGREKENFTFTYYHKIKYFSKLKFKKSAVANQKLSPLNSYNTDHMYR